MGETFAASSGGGALLNGRPIAVAARTALEGARVLATASHLAPAFWRGGPPRVERHFRPSLAYRLCLVAEGRFDAALTFRDVWEWDVAAGHLILQEAGGVVTTAAGDPPRYNAPQPVLPGMVVAGPAVHAAILALL
jgi:myo-inositol-1(or 4)-monophosphatase